jgi:hypothetical protein
MRSTKDPAAIAQYERDYEALLLQPNRADLDAFVRWLAASDDWQDDHAKPLKNGRYRVAFDNFDELWTSYVLACEDLEMKAVPHRVLMAQWGEIGKTQRPNPGRKRRRVTKYIIELTPRLSHNVFPLVRAA